MKINLFFPLFLFAACFPLRAFALESANIQWDKKGEIRSRIYQDAVDNNAFEDKLVTDSMVLIKNNVWMLDHELLIKADVEGRLETFDNHDPSTDTSLRFKEDFLELTKGAQVFTFGEKIVTWGKLDDVVILDKINPQDYRRFVLYDKQERKRSALMFKYDYNQEDWKVESVFKPFFKPSLVNFFGSDWAVFQNLKQAVADSSVLSQAKKNIVSSIAIEDQDNVTDNDLKNGEAGIRFASKMNDVDYSLYYMNVHNSIPVLKEKTATGNLVKKFLYIPNADNLNALEAASPTGDDFILEKAHPRLNVIGADWETVIGAFGIRGETGVLLGQPFLRDDFSYVKKNLVSVGLGIDHTTSNDTYIDVQLIIDHVMDYERLFEQEENSKRLTGSIRKSFKRGIVNFNLDWSYSLSYQDTMINPRIEYKFNNGVSVSFGGFIFMGDQTTTFGAFTTKDLIYTEIKYLF
ncbi:MAG: hypothetical protein HQL24_07565 [Candidatus Omnitrophica bacterium]|nr:hypothetical protein [Candidatus Omnitrophota bacterium]